MKVDLYCQLIPPPKWKTLEVCKRCPLTKECSEYKLITKAIKRRKDANSK